MNLILLKDARKHRTKESKEVIPLEFVILGTPGSGKTSLIYRFFFGEFNENGHRSVFHASYLSKVSSFNYHFVFLMMISSDC